MKILLFGALHDAIGSPVLEMDEPDTESLKAKLIADYPLLAFHRFEFAVNKKIISANQPLNNGDEVALLPPFAGG